MSISMNVHDCRTIHFAAQHVEINACTIVVTTQSGEFELALFGLPPEQVERLITALGPPHVVHKGRAPTKPQPEAAS
jgi:hypothetical protein